MYPPRRSAFATRVQPWPVLFGLLGIAGLLLLAGRPSPVSQALAQSEAATPSALPQPDGPAPPAPTAHLGQPPLSLQSSASVASAGAGQQFNFTATVAGSSAEPRSVELRATIDGQLELLSASASGGSCSGGATLVCKFTVRSGQPATIVAAVRVRPNAAPDSRLIYQVLAQDDQSNTAASDQVVVTVAGALPTPANPPPNSAPNPASGQAAPASDEDLPGRPTVPASQPTRTARPAATAAPAGGTSSDGQASSQPTSAAPAAQPVVPIGLPPVAQAQPAASIAVGSPPAAGVAPAAQSAMASDDSWLASVPAVPAPASDPPALAQVSDPAASALWSPAESAPPQPAQIAPAPQEAPAALEPKQAQQRPVVLLPNTAATLPAAGFVVGLLGLALVVHGLRRVRRAAAQLDRQGAALGRLAALLEAEARRRARVQREAREDS